MKDITVNPQLVVGFYDHLVEFYNSFRWEKTSRYTSKILDITGKDRNFTVARITTQAVHHDGTNYCFVSIFDRNTGIVLVLWNDDFYEKCNIDDYMWEALTKLPPEQVKKVMLHLHAEGFYRGRLAGREDVKKAMKEILL